MGIKGVVFGILNTENTINVEQNKELAELAHPMEVTFHKAIDVLENPLGELPKLLKINNVTRILTSGKSRTAIEGADLIKEMSKVCEGKITILPAGKITNENLELFEDCGNCLCWR